MPQRYLVVGLAKTGTTVISKTIQNTCGIRDYVLEPRTIAFFETFPEKYGDAVVKILFDHWKDRIRLLDGVIRNELGTEFTRTIFITRDPRAELVSRLHYLAFHHFQKNASTPDDVEKLLEIFRRKEADPEGVSLRDMVEHLRKHFSVFGRGDMQGPAGIGRRYANFVSSRPFLQENLLRYEDFIAGRLEGHPCAALFSGNREVGETLCRTKRADDTNDWASFILPSDEEWLNRAVGPTMDNFGYVREVPSTPKYVAPENSSLYVARLIADALAARRRKTSPVRRILKTSLRGPLQSISRRIARSPGNAT